MPPAIHENADDALTISNLGIDHLTIDHLRIGHLRIDAQVKLLGGLGVMERILYDQRSKLKPFWQ